MTPLNAPGRVLLRQTWAPADTDAAAYIAAVEAADGQALEERTRKAIDDFVLGCKADGIWSAIKASCILAGARTLTGALVPLAGAAPTNFNFVSGDYNRKTGLKGGTGKRLDSNRLGNADAWNNAHFSVHITESVDSSSKIGAIDGGGFFNRISSNFRIRTAATVTVNGFPVAGFAGASTNGTITARGNKTEATGTSSAGATVTTNVFVFTTDAATASTADRLAFYSIGESLDLTLLDARVTQLITTFAAVIP